MDWLSIYSTYSDELLITLSNPGLLRRAYKDLEQNSVSWISQDEKCACLAIDGHEVRLNAKGIPAASCSCPAPGICKHILTVSLWLRSNTASGNTSSKRPVIDDLLDQEPTAIFKSAGIANLRKARQLLSELSQSPIIQESDSGLTVELIEMELTVTFLTGGTLETAVSSAPEKQAKAIHLAALISVWQAHNKSFNWPTAVTGNEDQVESVLTPEEEQIIEQTRKILAELLGLGLAHISNASAQRLRSFSLSARAEGLPRLAGLLRTLSGLISALAEREQQVNPLDVLRQLAHIYAWCEACSNARDSELALLRGQVQRQFNERESSLSLLPLGAWWWHNPSGARGLSLALLDLHAQEILLAVQARPNGLDTQFNQGQAWSRTPLWPGSGSAASICESSLQLENARLTSDGRIALGGETRATIAESISVDHPLLASAGITNWQELSTRIANANGLQGYGLEAVLLRPRQIGKPQLDDIAQRFTIAAIDQYQQQIFLSLPASNDLGDPLAHLENLLQKNASPWGLLARINYSGFGYQLEPVSILLNNNGKLRVEVLAFADVKPMEKAGLTNKLRQLFKANHTTNADEIPRRFGERLATALTPILEALALSGRLTLNQQQRQTITLQTQHAQAVGLQIIQHQLDHLNEKKQITPEDLFKTCYLIKRLNLL
jgi:hypothetical protein